MNKFIFTVILWLLTSTSSYAQLIELEQNIKTIIKDKKATVGVSILFDDNTSISINDGYRYPTMSVYKFYEALAILDSLNKKRLPLETEIFINKSDLLPKTHSPLRDKYPNGDIKLSIKELLEYSICYSDNNACDILFKYIGGPEVVNKYVKDLKVNNISIIATEEVMNENIENQYLNWTVPSSSTSLLNLFLEKNLFPQIYKDFLINTLISTTSGPNKIKGLLPKDVVVGHKTGSSFRNEFGIQIGENDLGFIQLPNGKKFTIGVFIMNSMESDSTNCSIIANISKLAYDYYNK